MLARLDLRGYTGDLGVALLRADVDESDGPRPDDIERAVADIIAAVRDRGDAAVAELTARFDGVDLTGASGRPDLRVHRDECRSALDQVAPGVLASLEFARDQILAYHEAQRDDGAVHERSGVHIRELVLPVDAAGLYVPGGRATYPSTVLMTAIPAKVAGVPRVVLCVPPDRETGRPPAATLAAAQLAGVDDVYRVGGAQAIAALAYGTESIAPVDVVVGPGNAFVAEAKRQVFGQVGIDGIAGPSEVVVVVDGTVDPRAAAADLLAQAEHGPDGRAVVVTWSEVAADDVVEALGELLADAPRGGEAKSTLTTGGLVVLVDDREAAMAVSNELAPEHLELMCADADLLVPLVRHAGAVFVGEWSPATIGDYVAGANHVLPTGGTARFAGALRVADFQKRTHVVTVDRDALRRVGSYAATLADVEGLAAHAQSIRIREGRS